MKIQDVIDEVNEVWGEEHEEKRKKDISGKYFMEPLGVFRDVSFILSLCNFGFFGLSYVWSPFRRYSKHIFACICIQLSILLF